MPFNQVSFQLPLPPNGSTRTSKDEKEGDDEEEVEEEGVLKLRKLKKKGVLKLRK